MKGAARPGDDYAVDGLSGATLTSKACSTVLISGWANWALVLPEKRT
jgi:Na+-transporting NADH:ubiquinone oxidoreductase subunit NqrC